MNAPRRHLWWILGALVLTAAVGWGTRGYWQRSANAQTYRSAEVERGAIRLTVSATGKLSARTTVEIGSQVSGQIGEINADFNTEVKAGQVIARITPDLFEARAEQARASLAIAQANAQAAVAAVDEAKSAADNSKRAYERVLQLQNQHLISTSDADIARANAEQTAARVRSSQAQVTTAQAAIRQSKASLDAAEADLEHTEIRAPIDGIVIARTVNVGQTVAASFQTPTLFTLAQDLVDMQLEVDVDEADIGRVQVGQAVRFGVDAFPDREFEGAVEQTRKLATALQNVVTYVVVVGVRNPDLSLLPGMTATVSIVVAEKNDVLKVPSAALRFQPTTAPSGGDRGNRAREDAGGNPADALAQRLKLDDSKRARLNELLAPMRAEIQAARSGGGGLGMGGGGPGGGRGSSPNAMRERMEARMVEALQLLRRELDPAQQLLLDAELTRRAAQRTLWVVDERGGLSPMRVQAGISDGTVTEVSGDRLKEGQRVVIGVATAVAGTGSP